MREKRGHTVSVLLPARNEAATVGPIVAALRRELVDEVPLIDVLEAVGLDAMARVDRGVRSHRNSSDAALARMAAQIQLTVHSRLRGEPPPGDAHLTQLLRQGDRFIAATHDIGVRERPPMVRSPSTPRCPPATRTRSGTCRSATSCPSTTPRR